MSLFVTWQQRISCLGNRSGPQTLGNRERLDQGQGPLLLDRTPDVAQDVRGTQELPHPKKSLSHVTFRTSKCNLDCDPCLLPIRCMILRLFSGIGCLIRLALSLAQAYVLVLPVTVIKRSGLIVKSRAFARAAE